MTDRPIIFSAPMVQAILDGRKTQTRRVLKPQPGGVWAGFGYPRVIDDTPAKHRPGDRLWVREACITWEGMHRDVQYRCDLDPDDWRQAMWDVKHGAPWKPRSPIHMPRWASRLTLVVTDVQVERVQEISESDARAEGLATVTKDGRLWKWGIPDRDGLPGTDDHGWHWNSWQTDPREAFRVLWDSINADRGYGWGTNPWVVAVTFETHRCNIDRMESDA